MSVNLWFAWVWVPLDVSHLKRRRVLPGGRQATACRSGVMCFFIAQAGSPRNPLRLDAWLHAEEFWDMEGQNILYLDHQLSSKVVALVSHVNHGPSGKLWKPLSVDLWLH